MRDSWHWHIHMAAAGQDSCRYQAKAVSNLLYGVSIDHFCSVTMDAVAVINDAVGGVSVQVMDDMTMVDLLRAGRDGDTGRGAGVEVCPEPEGTG